MFPQLLCHLWGDYILQSNWMAQNKRYDSFAALWHSIFYSLPFFIFLHARGWAFLVIWFSHFLIDRFGLARYLVWAKNWIGTGNLPWSQCSATGNMPDCPPFLAVWLTIIADNCLHLTINYLALRYL